MNNEAKLVFESDDDDDDTKKESEKDKISFMNSTKPLYDPQASSTLWKVRKIFLSYPLLFIFIKILLGSIFLVLPIILFRIILTKIQLYTDEEAEYYIYAFIPLIVSVSIIMFYYLFLIVYRLISTFCVSRYCINFINYLNLL
jgi:hypothetical protein